MTVAESPPKGVEPSGVALGDEIPRPRRRRRVIALSVAALTAGAALLLLGRGGTDTAPRRPDGQPQGSRPPASVPAGLNRPAALAAAPDGSVLISNQGTHQILRRSPNGSMEVVVGTGTAGYSGDGGPAVDAEIDTPWGVAVGADGTVYIADSGNNRIRAVSTDGRITSFAGTGVAGSSGDGGPATAANVNQPLGVAVAADGRLFIAEADRVRVVSPEGTIRTLIVGGPASLPVNGQLNAFFPSAIAVTASGDLFVAGLSPKLIAEFDAGGRLRNVWENVYVTLAGLAAAPDGSIVVGDYGHFSIDTIAGSTLSTLAAFAPNSVPGLAGSFRPSGVTVGADGTVYAVTNGVNGGASEPALIAIDARDQVTRLDVPSST